MGIFVGIGNYIGRVRQIGDGGGQPIGPNDYYIITEDEIAVLTERGKHILLDKYVTEDEIATWVKEHMVFWYDMSKPVDVYAENFNDWQNYNPNSVSITNNKIVVNGLIDNFRIASIGKETESFSVSVSLTAPITRRLNQGESAKTIEQGKAAVSFDVPTYAIPRQSLKSEIAFRQDGLFTSN